MNRTFTNLALGLLLGMAAYGATTNTTLTVKAKATIGATGSISATGTASLSNIGDGTFSGSLDLSAIGGANVSAPFTITLSGGTLKGTLVVPAALLTSQATSGTGSATITGGTGSYEGATGSFPNLSGTATGSLLAGFDLTFTGPGTITAGGSGGGPQTSAPNISAVLDAGSYTPNIAQGSIFVVKGTNLSASGFTQFQFPLPQTNSGVKITFTPSTGGTGTDAYLIYLYNQGGTNQLAALLPSSVAPGNYNVTVTAGGATSTPFAATVVQRKLGLITQDSTGTGLAVVQNYISASQLDVDRLTTGSISGITISPSKPGQVLIAWATGMGPVSGGDNTASPGYDFAANGVNVKVLVGGVSVTPLYAGRAPGLAGTDQINFTLPSNVPTGCAVSFQISVDGVLSNPATLAIAPSASDTACVQPGYTTQQLQDFDNGKSFTTGFFYLSQLSETIPQVGSVKLNSVAGAFAKITGFQLGSASASAAAITPTGACQVSRSVTTRTDGGGSISVVNLDAGAVTLNGPAGSNIANLLLTKDSTYFSYSATLASEGFPSLPGASNGTIIAGKYTLSGAGGKDVGKFTADLTLGTPISVTGGLPTTVNRSAGLTLNWTGGLATDIVQITGGASVVTGTGSNQTTDYTSFVCTTTADKGTFTVPASILQQLPATSADAGSLSLMSTPNPTSGNGIFSAPLTSGGSIDNAYFLGLVGFGATVSYQ